MPTFTLSQKKAHDHQRHISITANAGSGKTSVLVSRYCDLVEYRLYNPEDIAAITFTEKAAAELRARIAREFEARLSDESHKPKWERLKTAREKFSSAVVTTIHGFCAQMLREFPIEADVPPNFAVISGYERAQMEETALMETIEQALADDPEPQFEEAYDAARRVGRERMEVILRLMLTHRESVLLGRRPDGILALDREGLLERWEQGTAAAVRSMTLNAETRPAIRELIDFLKEEPADQARSLLHRAERSTTIEEYLVNFNGLLREILLTQAGTPRKKNYDIAADDFESLEAPVALLKNALKSADDFLSADPDPELHRMLFDDTSVFLRIYDRAMEHYNRRKELVGGLDFEDLQLRLYEALENEEARERIAGRFKYIMVDEFQDTNELQYRVVRRMARDLTNIDLLCIVGDRKQSIYGFRGAEVEVFTQATEDIRKINRNKDRGDRPFEFRDEPIEPDSRDEGLGEIHLDASFRLLPGICAYVNAACAPVMRPPGGAEFGVDYEPLVCARSSDGPGIVEAILVRPEEENDEEAPGGNGPEADDECVSEAEMIARRIHRMVSDAEPLVWECPEGGNTEEPRPVRFSDIAILCRKRKTFTDIEQALRRKGIPFLTHGSSGYFRMQEVYDIVNYLRTLLNERDDISLLGLLRSPFFAVSDAELYRISLLPNRSDRDNSLWGRSLLRVETGQASEPLARAVAMIEDDRSMASRIPVSLLLKRIVERTGWRGAVIGAERGEQMVANVDKLIDMARDFESRGFTNLFDFVERVTAQIDAEDAEAEAAVNSSRDAVRLMTMHGAKGLEFPVVFLPSLHEPTRVSTPPYFDKELGFGWNWTYNGDEYRPMITALMKLKRRRREQAEEARLFYVAVTRARDALILCGRMKDEPPPNTMLAWGLAPLSAIPDENAGVRLRTPSLGFLDRDGATITFRPWEQEVQVRRTVSDGERYRPERDSDPRFRADLLQIGELPARARGEIYSASQFLTYAQCPTKYYLRYRLGIPEELSEAWAIDPTTGDSEDGTAHARLFREGAKRIEEMVRQETGGGPENEENKNRVEIREEKIDAIIDDLLVLEPMEEEKLTSLRERLRETFRRLLSSGAALERIFPAGSTSETAKELRIPFGSPREREYILGVMDRLTRHPDGTLSFLQYKTLRLQDRDPAQVADSYLPQLRLYGWLVSRLNPGQRSITGTILFTDAPDAPQDFPFSRFDLVRVEEEIRANIEDIRALSYSGRSRLPLRTPHCPICPYWIEGECLLGKKE